MKKFCEWWDSFKKRINELPKTNIFLYVVVILLCIGFTLSICKINHLNSRLDTQCDLIIKIFKGDKETEQQLKSQKFKEDVYIKQQERDSNLILTVIPLLFGLVGFFIFQGQKEILSLFKGEINNKISEQVAKYDEAHNNLLVLEKNLFELGATIDYYKADDLEKDKQYKSAFYANLFALKSFAGHYNSCKKLNKEQDAQNTLKLIINMLKKLKESTNLNTSEKDFINTLVNDIRKVENTEVNILLSEIQTKANQQLK